MKTLIFDGNHLMYRCFFIMRQQMLEDSWGFLRHLFLNSVLSIQKMAQADELIIAFDDKKNWRKNIYPGYKANRKDQRESDINWEGFFKFLNKFQEELKLFPFKILQIDYAEADDIIGVLCKNLQNNEIIVVSSDKDFKQLLRFDNVDLYDPIKNELIDVDDPNEFLIKHILQGDNSDNIKDVKTIKKYTEEFKKFLKNLYNNEDISPSYKLIAEKEFLKQNDYNYNKVCSWKPGRIGPKTADKILKDKKQLNELKKLKSYKLNQILIDLSKTPKIISERIMKKYKHTKVVFDKDEIKKYFNKNKLNELTEELDEDIEVFFSELI